MGRPIFFYVKMPEGQWSEEPLTFAAASAWIFAFGVTITVFFTQYLPTGLTLLEGLTPLKLLIVSPVVLVIASVFFGMTVLVIGGIMMVLVLGILYGVGVLIHFTLRIMGGKGNFFEMIKGAFYSGAAFLFGLIPCIIAIFAKYKLISFWQFQMSENIVYYIACIYIYGLWAIAGKKIHDVPRWKAFVGALLPLIVLVLVQIFLNAKIFPRVAPLFS